MLGAILGDIVGSPYEFDHNNYKHKDFPLLSEKSHFTDDTVMTVAVARGLMAGQGNAQKTFRFLYKGIIIKHNKTEPTYTKTSLFLCEKRRFLWPGLRKEGNLFKLAGPGGLAFFHLTKKEVSKWPMKK